MKNHYIPQFIIKKFSKAINVFYFETKELLYAKKYMLFSSIRA